MPSLVKSSAWTEAARLLARWFARGDRMDALTEAIALAGAERANCQHLVFGAVRHAGRIGDALARLIPKPPRPLTRAILHLAGFELIERQGEADSRARIVHHAVEAAKALTSAPESRLVNAVARALGEALAGQRPPGEGAPAREWAGYYSHPEWLVRRWQGRFGAAATRALLEWDLSPAPVHARLRAGFETAEAPPWLLPTRWPGFFEVASGHWAAAEAALAAGRIYVQDPATRIPVELLDPKPGESVLDLCAAPGGKSLMIADRMTAPATAAGGPRRPESLLVALDLPGPRLRLLRENLERAPDGVRTAAVEADVRDAAAAFRAGGLPASFSAVLVDVPCSNTGVMRHRVDVKWRLREEDFARHSRRQTALLEAASGFVAPGGRLVYSTCSVDPAENEEVVAAFLATRPAGFRLASAILSRPWESGHDGGGAFLLLRDQVVDLDRLLGLGGSV